jgi:hypothetical protein
MSKSLPMVFQKNPNKKSTTDLFKILMIATPLGTFLFFKDFNDIGMHTPMIHINLQNTKFKEIHDSNFFSSCF